MAVKTGSTAELRFKGAAIAKVRDVSLTIVRDALETTGIGQRDRTYAYGIRGTTGTGTLLYDSANPATTATMNRLLSDSESTDTIAMVLDTSVSEGTLTGDALITQAGVSVSVGSVVSVPISFSFSGKPAGGF
jgi:hypothetical protein|tara:strand:+ start:437 stop:835 length:399 start_codon:yes stop_codon:yes gene_type:complete